MELRELVEHLNKNSNRWPDSSFADLEGNLAKMAETRLLKVIGDHRVILTMNEYWPAGVGAGRESASFTVHMGEGADLEVTIVRWRPSRLPSNC